MTSTTPTPALPEGMDFPLEGVRVLDLSRVFAGGHVFTEGLLDKLLCEAYYNPRVPQVRRVPCATPRQLEPSRAE